MKKIYVKIMLMLLLVLCITMLTACNDTLSTPSGLTLDVDTQTLRWNYVKGAAYYTIHISGEENEITTKANTVSLESLVPGDYEIRIKANGDGAVSKDSGWVTYHFTRTAESGLRYELINNGTAYQLVGGGLASGVVVMEEVFRGKPVIAIADKALYNNTEITSFTVGKNVKTIGEKAFAKCEAMIDITIPEGVTTLGRYAFQSCKSLSSIELPDSITQIPAYAFAWCASITDVVLGNQITGIQEYAFSDCTALTNITYRGCSSNMRAALPDTMGEIGMYAFADCRSLQELDIGNTKSLGEGAFMNSEGLRRVDLGERLQTIGNSAFCNCLSLTAITVPDSTQSIAEKAFLSCQALDEVKLGTGLTSIGKDAFTGTSILDKADKKLVIDGWLIRYMDEDAEKLTISGDIYGIASFAAYNAKNLVQVDIKGVKYVNMAAFAYCQDLDRVVFDDTLQELGDYAFFNCPFLLSADLGESITSIGHYAFQWCAKLTNIQIPASVTYVGTRAFRNTPICVNVDPMAGGVVYLGDWAVDYFPSAISALLGTDISAVVKDGTKGIASYTFSYRPIVNISIADSVEYICKGAFYSCKTYNINIPKSLKHLGDYAFYGCEETNFGDENFALVLPEGTNYIGRSAFYGCLNIVSATIPGTVEYIGPYAFYNCEKLGAIAGVVMPTDEVDENGDPIVEMIQLDGTLVLQDGVQSIGERAFQGCVGLREIAIPDSVTNLGAYAFYQCEKLEKVSIGSGVTKISRYAFYKCTALAQLEVSDRLESIGDYAFKGCENLRSLDLKSVRSIGRYSFHGCASLETLVLPDTLTAVGDYAFRGCTAMKTVIVPENLMTIGKHAFYGLRNLTMYCRSAQAQPGWNGMYNSSHRPIFWGCKLSDDGAYVVAVTVGENTLTNPYATNGLSAPVREGYTFAGWATEQGSDTVVYTMQNMLEAAEGTVLYAVWKQ